MLRKMPTRINHTEAPRVLKDRRPLETFYVMPTGTESTVTAIDNRTGYCWTEEFDTLEEAMSWLNDEFERVIPDA